MPYTTESDHDAIHQARMRAGGSLRDLGHAFVGRHMSVEQIDRLSEVLREITDELWPGAPRSRGVGDLPFPTQAIPEGRLAPDYSDRPVSGLASPWSFDLDLSREGDEIVAHVGFRSAHEGAPGRAHGGLVAALFDDVMGFVLGLIQQPAFTGELTTRYVGPTPLHTDLECRARCTGRDGRKILMTAELNVADTGAACATATATFIAVDGYATDTAERPLPREDAPS